MATTIYGASDDLVELDGDISEEFMADTFEQEDGEPDGGLLGFSDGTILRIVYGERGVWRISPIVRGPLFDRIEQAAEDDDENYSDRAYLHDGATSVVFGVQYARARTGSES